MKNQKFTKTYLIGLLCVALLLVLSACSSKDANATDKLIPVQTNTETQNDIDSPSKPTLEDVDKPTTSEEPQDEPVVQEPTKPISSNSQLYVHAITAKATRSGADRWLVNVFYYDVSQTPLNNEELSKLQLELNSTGRSTKSTYDATINCSKVTDIMRVRKASFGYDFEKNLICVSPNFDMTQRQTLTTTFKMSEALVSTVVADTPAKISATDVVLVIQ
jgi:hypothetical protein